MKKLKQYFWSNLSVFKNLGVYSLISIISGALNFVFISYYAMILNLEQMGVIGLVLAITYITVPAAIFGTNELVGINVINYPLRNFLIFFNNLNTFTLHNVPILIIIAVSAAIYFKQGVIYSLVIILFSIVRAYIGLSDKIYVSKRKVKSYAIEKIRTSLLTLVIGIITLHLYPSWISFFISVIFAELISCYFRYYKGLRFLSFKNKWQPFLIMYSYGLPYMIGLGGAWFLNQFDKVFVEKYFGTDVLGGYALAYQIGIIIRTFNTAIINAAYPNLYESFKKGNYLKVQLKYFLLFVIISFMILFLLILFVQFLFLKIYGVKYESFKNVIIIIGISFLFEGMYKVWDSLITYLKKNSLKTTILYFSSAIGVTITLLLINHFGILAPAYGVVSAYFSLLMLSLFFSLRLGKSCHI